MSCKGTHLTGRGGKRHKCTVDVSGCCTDMIGATRLAGNRWSLGSFDQELPRDAGLIELYPSKLLIAGGGVILVPRDAL